MSRICATEYSRRDLRQLSGGGDNQHKAVRLMFRTCSINGNPFSGERGKSGASALWCEKIGNERNISAKNNAFDDPVVDTATVGETRKGRGPVREVVGPSYCTQF